jgi:hypothetical protein
MENRQSDPGAFGNPQASPNLGDGSDPPTPERANIALHIDLTNIICCNSKN